MEQGEAAASLGLPLPVICSIEPLPSARHVFSHVEWHMIAYRLVLSREAPKPRPFSGAFMADREALKREYALPSAFAAYRKLIG